MNTPTPQPAPQPQTPPQKRRMVWNWRMLLLGLLLNAATIALVLYTFGLLNDYRECTNNQALPVIPSGRTNTNTSTNVNTNANTNAAVNASTNTAPTNSTGSLPD